jgi:hypothetical protein
MRGKTVAQHMGGNLFAAAYVRSVFLDYPARAVSGLPTRAAAICFLTINLENKNKDFKYFLKVKQLAIAGETFKWKMDKDFKVVDDADGEEYEIKETRELAPKDVENMFLLRY